MQTDLLFKELHFDHEKYSRKKRETGQYHQIRFGDPIPQELNADATKAWEATARIGKIIIANISLSLSGISFICRFLTFLHLFLYHYFSFLRYHYFLNLYVVSFFSKKSHLTFLSGTKLKITEVKIALLKKLKEKYVR